MMTPDREQFWLMGSLLLTVLAILTLFSRRRAVQMARNIFLIGAPSVAAVAVAVRWERTGQGPFLTLFEVLLSNVFSLGMLIALLWFFWRNTRPATGMALAFVLLLGVWALLVPAGDTPFPPAFENPWLWVHVIAGKLFLGLLLIAAGIALAQLWSCRNMGIVKDDGVDWRLLGLAFLFQTVMLVAGAAWAHSAWGHYWSWDPL